MAILLLCKPDFCLKDNQQSVALGTQERNHVYRLRQVHVNEMPELQSHDATRLVLLSALRGVCA